MRLFYFQFLPLSDFLHLKSANIKTGSSIFSFIYKFAFVERSRTMKAPVGLLSDRTVLRSKMEGLCPDKFRVVELSRVYHTIPQSASKTKRTTDRSRWFLSTSGALSTAIEPKTSSRVTVLASSVKLKLSTTRSSKT